MKKLLLLLVVMLGFVACAFAMNIETGKEFSDDRDQKMGKLLPNVDKEIPGVSIERRIENLLVMTNQKMQELYAWVIEQKKPLIKSQFTQEDMRKHHEERVQHIKAISDEVKTDLDNIVKQSNFLGCASAINIETGKEFSDDRDQKTGNLLSDVNTPDVSTGHSAKEWIHMARKKVYDLLISVAAQGNPRMKKITKEGMREHIKTVSDEVKMDLDNAVKQAHLEK